MLIAPSILNANNLDLKNEIKRAANAGITRFHIDVMDGHFVPNLSFGPQLISDFKREFPLIDAEVHLMSDEPKTLVPEFVKAGADIIELHYEAMSEDELGYWFDYLASNGVKASLVLNPDTPIDVVKKFIDQINQVLIMSVKPGFGGQKYLSSSNERIAALGRLLDQNKHKIPIEVDGGVNLQTIGQAKKAGAEIFVAGSAIYEGGTVKQQIEELENALQ